jgi:ADP-heptose:LPS heptosyltransferase
MQKFLIIQTAFTGDVVLATAIVEKLHARYPHARIDFLLRKGNEGLLQGHPYIEKLHVWNKKHNKLKNLLGLIREVRRERYDEVINLHRFASSGIVCLLSGAKRKSGFDKNPLSFFFDRKIRHVISDPYTDQPVHEVERNQQLIGHITDAIAAMPVLYPAPADYETVRPLQQTRYTCIAPASVWFTKQFPEEKWTAFISLLPAGEPVYLLGGKDDYECAERIAVGTGRPGVINLCGKLSYLQSAALMQGAVMNYVNDSAPLHFCSAMKAPVTAIFCSTVPAFGFGPLGENARIVEIKERLYCRPCGLHGHKACPEGHFKCALQISNEQLLTSFENLKI